MVPVIADRKGRKWVYFFSILGTAVCIIGMMLAKSLWVIYLLMFLGGVLTSGRFTTGYVYGNEFCAGNWQVVWGTVQAFEDGAITLIISLYYDFISKQYIPVFCIALVYCAFSLLVVGLFAPESPLWQIKMGYPTKAYLSLKKILRFNGNAAAADELDQELESGATQFDSAKVNYSAPVDSEILETTPIEETT